MDAQGISYYSAPRPGSAVDIDEIKKSPATIKDPHNTPKKPGHLRFICMSDTHVNDDCFKNVPDGDVFLLSGDSTYFGSTKEVKKFVGQLNTLPHKTKIIIAGNHELTFDLEKWNKDKESLIKENRSLQDVEDAATLKQMVIDNCTHYLENSAVPGTIGGYKIWGSPCTPWMFDWAFNVRRGPDIRKKWDMIPTDTDIIMTHGPPLGYGDQC